VIEGWLFLAWCILFAVGIIYVWLLSSDVEGDCGWIVWGCLKEVGCSILVSALLLLF